MTLLVVSPDYASHLVPLLQVAIRWRDHHGRAVVATGPATRPLVEAAGVEWVDLRLGRGRNAGVIEVTDQPEGEDRHLQAFFDATRRGPIATLTYQAEARRHDLLHDPDGVLDRLDEILAEVEPDRVVVDHVSFGARLALHALGVAACSVVLGHPSALSAPGEVYGLPSAWPSAIVPDDAELAGLRERCRAAVDDLASASAELLARRAPHRPPVGDLTSRPSPSGLPTVYASPRALHDPSRPLPPGAVFVGSLAREEVLGDVELPAGDGPLVVVALGSFLGARHDVLATAVRAARIGGWRLALASGSSPVELLGELPSGALVARHLPQVALLAHADAFVNHGGNGSVTESAAAGVPQVVLPFSTDQFALAAAVEATGVGVALEPNTVRAEQLADAVARVLRPAARAAAAELARAVAESGGPAAAVDAIAAATD